MQGGRLIWHIALASQERLTENQVGTPTFPCGFKRFGPLTVRVPPTPHNIIHTNMFLQLLLAILCGILAGIFTGLIPGIHINLISLILLSLSPILLQYTNPITLCCFIIAMSVTHTFLDAVPSVFLGAPDADQALNVLPGHKLLLEGKGFEAVKLTVIGSLLSLILATALIPLLIPFCKIID